MSNPGVIKIAQKQIGQHRMWIDDNIGESVHIHYDQIRIELSIKEFLTLTNQLKEIFFNLYAIDPDDIDIRYLYINSQFIYNIRQSTTKMVKLSSLKVFDPYLENLVNCSRVKALKGKLNIDDFPTRNSNFYGQSNSNRLARCLDYITKTRIEKVKEITVIDNYGLIIDGWHRASCLYSVYGDILINVKIVSVDNLPEGVRRILPDLNLGEHCKVVLYGAGDNGRNYYEQLKKTRIELVGWVDKEYLKKGMIEDCVISSPEKIKELEYEYVIVSILDRTIQQEATIELMELGVEKDRIIFA